jgi:hypothetical protein
MRIRYFPALIVSLTFLAQPSFGDDGPTLKETLAWLTDKIGSFEQAPDFKHLSWSFTKGQANKFELRMRDSKNGTGHVAEFALADLNPDAVQVITDKNRDGSVAGYYVRLSAAKKVIRFTDSKGGVELKDNLEIYFFNDGQLTERLAKALRHGITLSGGKKEAF